MTVVGTGCFFSLIFHLGTKEPPQAVVEKNLKGKTKHFNENQWYKNESGLPHPCIENNLVNAFNSWQVPYQRY